MLVGHFAVGFVAKRIAPEVSLGTLVLASMLPDLLWAIFQIAGIEHVQFKPGMGAANYFAASDVAMSHSLLMDAIWAALFASSLLLAAALPTWGVGTLRGRSEPLAARCRESQTRYAVGARRVQVFWIRTLEFLPRNLHRRRRLLVARHHPLCSCYAS